MLGRKNLLVSSLFLVFFLLLLLRGIVLLDPDFGWHLASGKAILGGNFPWTDTFSYSMPSYQVIYHSWLTSATFTKIYSVFGIIGLSIICSLMALGGLYFAHLRTRKFSVISLIELSLLAISFVAVYPFMGVRSQLTTFFFYSLLLYLLFETQISKALNALLVLLFFGFWANFHGGFAMGLATLIIVVALRSFRKKALDFKEVALILGSIFVTGINPYGFGIWKEVLGTFGSGALRGSIVEWSPSFFVFEPAFLFLIAFSCLLVWKYKKKLFLEEVVLYFLMLIQAISALRNIPLWVLVAYPLATQGTYLFYGDVKSLLKNGDTAKRFKSVTKVFFALSALIFAYQLSSSIFSTMSFSENRFYPKEAVSYLRQNPSSGNVLSQYNWGGYLVWKYPERKVFVDGRMAIWDNPEAPENESKNAFEEYSRLLRGEVNADDFFKKYNIDTILWPRQATVKHIWFVKGKTPKGLEIYKLPENGWKLVYEDSLSVILRKVDYNSE